MKIVKFEAENVKRLKAVSIAPDGSIVQITGKNGAGKSSVLDSIYYALAGGKALPKEPIRRGEKSARIKLDLGKLIVTRKFGENGVTSLIVESATGARYSSPQRMLDELLGAISFDPLAFSRMEPKAQFDMLRAVSNLDVDLESLAGKNKTDFETRTDVNRRAKALRAQAEGIKVPEGLPEQTVDVDALLSQMQEASRTNSDIERRKVAREQATASIARQLEEAMELEERAKRLRAGATELEERLKNSEPLPELVDVTALRKSIDDARVTNITLGAARRKDELIGDAMSAEAQAKALTEAIEARNQAKNDALAAAKMPIPDIALGEGIVLYKGLPFDQASSAEQLRVSVAIAMATNPKLRVLRIKEGGLLDEDGMHILREMTEAADYQVWIETVHANGPVAVEMVDGSAKAAPPLTPIEEAAANA